MQNSILYSDSTNFIHEEVQRLINFDHWSFVKQTKTSKISKTQGTSEIISAFKLEQELVGYEATQIQKLIDPLSKHRQKFDPFCENCLLLQEINENVQLVHSLRRPILRGLIGARDTIELFNHIDNEQYFGTEFGSVELDEYPPTENSVRAWTFPSCFLCTKPNSSSKWSVATVIIQSDLKMPNIPTYIIESAVPSMMIQLMDGLFNSNSQIEITNDKLSGPDAAEDRATRDTKLTNSSSDINSHSD